MYIKEFEVSNLKCFKGTHKVSLAHADGEYAGWTVLAGRNGSGKSTLLKALALSVIGPKAAQSLVGVFSDWVKKGEEEATIATLLDFDRGAHDGFQRVLRAAGSQDIVAVPAKPFHTGLIWKSAHIDPEDRVTRKTANISTDVLSAWLEREQGYRKNTPTIGPWVDDPDGWFIAGYGPYRHLGAPSSEVQRLSYHPVFARLTNLFYEEATLSEGLEWLKTIHTRFLENRDGAAELRDAILMMLDDGLLPDGNTVKDVDSEGLWIKHEGAELQLERLSDGYRTVAALVVDILRRLHDTYGDLMLDHDDKRRVISNRQGVVLIDEVDSHLHVSWQQEIGFWLTRHFPKLQFIVTTHSPFICQAASPKGLIRLPGPGENRKIEHVSDATYRAVVQGGADDAVMTELFGLDFPHSSRAEAKRRRLADLEAKLLAGSASEEEQEEYQELKEKIATSLDEMADSKLRALLRRS